MAALKPEEQREQIVEFANVKRREFLDVVLESSDAAVAEIHSRCQEAYVKDRAITEAIQVKGMIQAARSPFLDLLKSKGIEEKVLEEEFVNLHIGGELEP